MKISMNTKALLNQLMAVSGAVENKSTIDVLTHVLIQAENGRLTLTGTNLTLQLIASRPEHIDEPGAVTAPLKKLLDICKNLPALSGIELTATDDKLVVKSGRSRYTMATISAREYPNVERAETPATINVSQAELQRILKKTAHAMASQDVRYYLNGTLLHLHDGQLRAVATDGHRLATCSTPVSAAGTSMSILRRDTATVLLGLLTASKDEITLRLGSTHMQAVLPLGDDGTLTYISSLVDGKYPDYQRIIPRDSKDSILTSRDEFAQALTRVSLLSDGKFPAGAILVSPDLIRLQLSAKSGTDEANDEVSAEYNGPAIENGFNLTYFIDALKSVEAAQAVLHLASGTTAAKITDPQDDTAVFIVMPCKI